MVGKWHLGQPGAFDQGFDYDRIIGKNGLDYYNYGISSKGKTVFEDDGSVYQNLPSDLDGISFLSTIYHPEKAKELYFMLKDWQSEIDAKMPVKKPGYLY